MPDYKEIAIPDIADIAEMNLETFNAPPWNDEWTMKTAGKRLKQMINGEDFYGLCANRENKLCDMILGSRKQFYDGIMFQVKEFFDKRNYFIHL